MAAGFNLLMLILVAPGVLLYVANSLGLGLEKGNIGYLCICPAIFITKILDLLPGNPYTQSLPFMLIAKLAFLLYMERPVEAEKLARCVINRLERTTTERYQIELAQGYCLLGCALLQQGKHEESRTNIDRAIELIESAKDLPELKATAFSLLSTTLANMGDVAGSIALGHRALDVNDSTKTSEQTEIQKGKILNNLAGAYKIAGFPEKAMEMYQKSLDLKMRIFGKNSQEVALTSSNIGCLILEMDKFEEALEWVERSREIALNLGLDKNGERLWLEILSNRGETYRGLGRLDEAEKDLLQAFSGRETKKHSEIDDSLHCLGKLYRDKGELETAQKYFMMALEQREKQYGKKHMRVGITFREYALLLKKMGRDAEFESMAERAENIIGEATCRLIT